MTKDKAAIARFERYVKAAGKLRHSNIVAADDADCANGVHFLVMELVDGQDLSALVKKNGPFSISEAANYVLQAARGLEIAHKKGVVHRDIKPADLLLDAEGTVKILDMGLGGVGDDAPQADLTSTGTIMGTVDYMAPQQALDTKTADARADIYALGCSLIVSLETKDGKLIVDVDQPDAMVQVLDSEGKVEISQKGIDGKVTISVDPGKHRLKVVQDNFTTYGQEFQMEQNGKKEITARLEPLQAKPVMGGSNPAPVAGEKKPLAFQTPGFNERMKKAAAIPAEQQVEAVSKKLVELNPGFDGKVKPTIQGGFVIEMEFDTVNVTDISPVRALVRLKTLVCGGSNQGKGKLIELTPLDGMKLTEIHFNPKNISKGIDLIRQMKSLEMIGVTLQEVFLPDEFWKKYDAGEFGKPTPLSQLLMRSAAAPG